MTTLNNKGFNDIFKQQGFFMTSLNKKGFNDIFKNNGFMTYLINKGFNAILQKARVFIDIFKNLTGDGQ